jgi:hypothetical protein
MEKSVHRRLLIACAVVVCLSGERVAAAEPPEDPWKGKTRSDVITLLGDPTKTKKTDDRGSVLIYKLLRLQEEAIPPPGLTVLDVPGIGVVGQMQTTRTMTGTDVDILPTEVDKQGRGTGGGVTEEENVSISWDKDGKKVERSWEERPAIRGKLTLKFNIAPGGEIESWSVSPKKAAADP